MQEAGYAAVSRPLAFDSPRFHLESGKRTHLSRLFTPRHGAVRRKQTGQATQINREHRQREHVADLAATTQLHLADRAAVLLAIAEQRLDHLADDLAGEVARMARGASVDAALAPRSFAGLGVIFVGVLRDVRVTLRSRQPATKPLVSKFLSAPTLLRCWPGRPFNISSAASCSAVPLASVTRVSTAACCGFPSARGPDRPEPIPACATWRTALHPDRWC